MASYEEQLKKWAAKQFELDIETIHSAVLDTDFSEGYACCGGSDPSCYCSFAESARMTVIIAAYGYKASGAKGKQIGYTSFDMLYGDMNALLKEIIEA